jgi:hypothetical protein
MMLQSGFPLADVEIDSIELSTGCAEQCSHCSEAPEKGVRHARPDALLDRVARLARLETVHGFTLFGNYWLPFPASDPFAHPSLHEICQGIWQRRGLPAYLLSLGWNRESGTRNARAFAAASSCLFRIAITVSNFSRLAQVSARKHRERLAASLKELSSLWQARGPDGKPLIILSPQYVGGLAAGLYSQHETEALLTMVTNEAGIDLDQWRDEGRIFARPVVALGKAITELGVQSYQEIPISAEVPMPTLARNPSRPYSGLITIDGGISIIRAPRGLLGRERHDWTALEASDLDAVTTLAPHSPSLATSPARH